jgi:hypothetical protein
MLFGILGLPLVFIVLGMLLPPDVFQSLTHISALSALPTVCIGMIGLWLLVAGILALTGAIRAFKGKSSTTQCWAAGWPVTCRLRRSTGAVVRGTELDYNIRIRTSCLLPGGCIDGYTSPSSAICAPGCSWNFAYPSAGASAPAAPPQPHTNVDPGAPLALLPGRPGVLRTPL